MRVLKLWLPIHIPAAASAATSDGSDEALSPVLNSVARTPQLRRAAQQGAGVGLSPSSKVRATYADGLACLPLRDPRIRSSGQLSLSAVSHRSF